MQDSYKIPLKDVIKAVTDAIQFGCTPMLIINGEYYDIIPETTPGPETEKSDNLQF